MKNSDFTLDWQIYIMNMLFSVEMLKQNSQVQATWGIYNVHAHAQL